MKNTFITTFFIMVCWFCAIPIYAQSSKVTVAPTIQRYLGEVSELEREKFFNMHSTWFGTIISQDEYLDYTQRLKGGFGRSFWGPFSWAGSKANGQAGVYPENEATIISQGQASINSSKQQATWSRRSNRHIVTEHPANVVRWSVDKEYAANWAAQYFKYFFTDEDRPQWFEVMNEPFVHAGDDVFKLEQPDDQKMRVRMAEWFGAIGKKFDETPELAQVKVIGYSSAWPSVELWDFGHWDTRMKMFMDVAGPHIDAFATHLYDGINVTGSDTKRSGSNSEAILDLIETYSYVKWGIVKPHAITEFGGIERGYPDTYSDVKSVQSIKSINQILFNLLNRENDVDIAIPFIGDKATWHINAANNYQPYGSVLWRPKVLGVPIDGNTEWVYTPRVHFFELWNRVQGKRVFVDSPNPDIQAHAFVDGNILFVALNNLDEKDVTVDLNVLKEGLTLTSTNIKRLKIWDWQDPLFTDENLSEPLDDITLIAGETAILELAFAEPLVFDNAAHGKKYYSSTHLTPIAGTLAFGFGGVDMPLNFGKAYLRLSIGRKHDKSKKPEVLVNGNKIPVPENWAGYDQANRDDFFGMIRIPVPISILQENNQVIIRFPDTGGHISSLILEVNSFDKEADVSVGKGVEYGVKVFPTLVKNNHMVVDLAQPGVFNKLSLIDLAGRVVYRSNVSQSQQRLVLNQFQTNGIFILQLTGANGELFTQKIVVQS